ncbi:DUF6082 family protein [Cryptosporangium phraense]|uniref:Uncharacterized protein n=1 Tax=Cryptosporangium phraense TaxID=2593070 RepID=A0A545AXW5_9ACTN|nr:DUF6082 family protein [Cryptosporangium phraense]TQS46183.1 hypothetical protein FL583_06820 [Cryptosporangium phraense]
MILTLGLIALLAAPIALTVPAELPGFDWQKVGAVGEAYGGVSALLSGAALIGVIVSTRQQSRQIRLARAQANRTLHFELIRYVIENPKRYAPYWGIPPNGAEAVAESAYINQILNFLRFGIESESFPVGEAKGVLKEVLAGEEGRRYWESRRSGWLELVADEDGRRFISLVDEAYDELAAHYKALPPPRDGRRSPAAPLVFLGAATIGAIALRALRRR